MKYKQNLFLWMMIITSLISFLANFSIYHFPGERSLVLMATTVLGLSNIGSMMNVRYKSLAGIFAIFSIIAMLLPLINGTWPDFKTTLPILFGYFFILLKNDYKLFIFDKIVVIISIIFLLSLIEFYALTFFNFGVKLSVVQRGESTFFFNHYLFNVVKVGGVRFQSLCAEPSSVGETCGIMLFLLDSLKKYRKSFYIFLIAGLTSLSLSFFAFLAMYAVWSSSRFNVKSIIGAAIVVAGAFYLIGDNLNQYIIERYQSGNYDDRASEAFMARYDNYLKSGDVWFGKGEGAVKEVDINGATTGFRREIYEVGVVGVLFIFLAFAIPYFRMSKLNLFILVVFAVFCVMYYSSSMIYGGLKIVEIFIAPALLPWRELEKVDQKRKLIIKQR